MRYARDIQLTSDGDLAIHRLGRDLGTVKDAAYIRQCVADRIKSASTEWVGADLEQYMGKANTKDTGDAIAGQIKAILMEGGLLDSDDIYVEVKPVDKYEIALIVFVRNPSDGEPITIVASLDFNIGIQIMEG